MVGLGERLGAIGQYKCVIELASYMEEQVRESLKQVARSVSKQARQLI